jgi:F420H(2)-dependent quinone reductase
LRIEHDGQYAIVGSSGGSPRHPTWYANVTAHPRVTLQDGATRQEYQAHEVHGAEYEEWWERALATYAGFGDYAAVAGRTFPVFVLTRVVDPR